MQSLCKMLEADAAAVLGQSAARFPAVLGAIAAVYEAETLGGTADASARLRALVHSWRASNGDLLSTTINTGVEKPHLREKLQKIAAA